MIPQETVDRILDAAQIDEVVSDFVTLKRRGTSFTACCPFHNEKTPSFYVTPSKGIYKCFGCGKAGSAVGFVMEHEHVSFVEALRYLAKKYHIEIVEKEESAEDLALKQRRESLMLASDFAQDFYSSQLSTSEGRTIGLAYFKSRGLDESIIRDFGLGWAPKGRHALVDAAAAAGYKPEYLADCGLLLKREDGSWYDRFSERVMFPIHTLTGRVVAYSARTLLSDYKERNIGKYVNSPETELYHKSNALYGIFQAKSEIARQDKCYLVEGNIDVLAMHQIGLRNTVASCGTALTEDQVRLIKKFTDNITIMYDGDSAGIHAAIKGIDLVLRGGLNVKVVLFPDGDDPDSYSRKHTLQEVQDFIESSEQDFITFRADQLSSDIARDPLKKAALISDLAHTISVIPDAVKRSVYVEAVAARFGIAEDVLFQRISSSRRQQIADEQVAQQREKRRQEANLPPLPGEAPVQKQTPVPQKMDMLITNRTVAAAEQDILRFILTHGTDILDFESDSEYYSGDEGEKPLVADFIRTWMDADNIVMYNEAFQKVYDAYMALYDEGLEQPVILSRLLDSPDRDVAFVAAQISTEKYRLTIKDFKDSLTSVSSWLVAYVPKAILSYMDSRLTFHLGELRAALASQPEKMEETMQEIIDVQNIHKKIKLKLGREKIRQ